MAPSPSRAPTPGRTLGILAGAAVAAAGVAIVLVGGLLGTRRAGSRPSRGR